MKKEELLIQFIYSLERIDSLKLDDDISIIDCLEYDDESVLLTIEDKVIDFRYEYVYYYDISDFKNYSRKKKLCMMKNY